MINKKNCWIQTYTGKEFNYFTFTEKDICIEDIAMSLSRIPRFNGHTISAYFVAHHSVLVSELASAKNLDCSKWGLLHDASEAYIADLVSPLKVTFPEYNALEERIHKAVAKKFKLSWPIPEEVKHADLVLLATEKRDIMGTPPKDWKKLPEPRTKKIIPWNSKVSHYQFMNRFETLFEV
jgi:5'-deoxynucleotidase YfbR-like HD superfamily hydrolase